MPSTPSTTYTLHVTLGFGSDQSVPEELNRACQAAPLSSSIAGAVGKYFSSSVFSSSSATSKTDTSTATKFFVASACHVEMVVDSKTTPTTLVAVLIPPSLVDHCLEKDTSKQSVHASGSCFWLEDDSASSLEKDMLHSLHSSIRSSTRIRGIVRTSIATEDNAPAEFLLLELCPDVSSKTSSSAATALAEILRQTNGEPLAADPTAILKVLPLSLVQFHKSVAATGTSSSDSADTSKANSPMHVPAPAIPTCPVCLHRIDPLRLGLPPPRNAHLCSKFCPPPTLLSWAPPSERNDSCPKQRFLQPWTSGARCKACQVIQHYWDHDRIDSQRERHRKDVGSEFGSWQTDNTTPLVPQPAGAASLSSDRFSSTAGYNSFDDDLHAMNLYCRECSMHKTLWVCLTCGHVGCGRYSNRHSVEHFHKTQHPYSLELATLRIWDYVHEDSYAHRVDLLECPSSPPLAHPSWIVPDKAYSTSLGGATPSMGYSSAAYPTASALLAASSLGSEPDGFGNFNESTEKTPKKATMIGEEYEALLQSALEDQAQHFEGQIARLRAEMAASLVDHETLPESEQAEVDALQQEIDKMREDIEASSRSLRDAQSQEARLRATSQRLLREQQEANTIIQKIERETREEARQGKLQVEELEQQVGDLTANLKMRQRFCDHEELNQAQIFGTNGSGGGNRGSAKRGKKKGRQNRK
eukprot:Nitzschia sp. Nitz4//scaffold182_size44100//22186//24282//NITZ4_007255-RA/size44100-processed-gene-0.43-mRNA-1//1//CDS//3329539568//2840//frame0